MRLSVVDAERIELKKRRAHESYYAQFTYAPQINAVSKAIGQGSGGDGGGARLRFVLKDPLCWPESEVSVTTPPPCCL